MFYGKIKALPSQTLFHRLKTKFRGYSGPVGSGKTLAMSDHLLYLAGKNAGRTGLLGAPTYPMLRDSALRTLMWRMELYGVKYEHNKGDKVIWFPDWRTTLFYRTLDDADRLRGTNLAFFGVDELSYCPELSWHQLGARLRDPLAVERAGCAAWTPKGYDWVYNLFLAEPTEEYSAIFAKPFENTYLPADYYKGLLSTYSPHFARQEIYGEYLNIFSGRVYQSFESGPNGNIWGRTRKNYRGFAPCLYRKDRPLLWALDFNINPMCSVIAQSVPLPGFEKASRPSDIGGEKMQLNVLDELYLPDSNTQAACEEFLARAQYKRERNKKLTVRVYADATGDSRKSSSTKTDIAIIKQFFALHADKFNVTFHVPEANPPVKDRTNAVNAVCCSATGIRRLAVNETCKELIRDLEQVAWKADPNGRQIAQLDASDKARTHISDALGYLVRKEWKLLRAKVGSKRAVVS